MMHRSVYWIGKESTKKDDINLVFICILHPCSYKYYMPTPRQHPALLYCVPVHSMRHQTIPRERAIYLSSLIMQRVQFPQHVI